MVRRSLTAVLALCLTAGLSLAACSGGGGGGDTGGDTGGNDASSTGGDTADGGSGSGGDGGTTDGDTGMASGGDGGSSDGSCSGCIDDKYKVENEQNCSNSSLPRCEESPSQYSDWGPASAVTKLDLASTDAQDCCFDLNGDGEVDNTLSKQVLTLLNSFSDGPPIRQQLKQSFTIGELIILTEHQGLEALDQSDPFKMNFLIGEYANADSAKFIAKEDSDCNFADKDCKTTTSPGQKFLVNPQSFDQGTQPQAQVPDATIEGSNVNAGPGKVVLNLSVAGLGNLNLVINGATIESKVDAQNSGVAPDGNGVILEEGRLGGYVLAKDLVTLVNNLLGVCECVDNPDAAITYPNTDPNETDLRPNACESNNPPDNCDVKCKSEVEMKASNNCQNTGSAICNIAGPLCSAVPEVFTNYPDLDVDGDGQNDALSIGALFETTGAQINGVAPFVSVKDQTVSSPTEVTVSSAFLNDAGWIVIHEEADGGGVGDIIGSKSASADWNRDVTVSLDREVEDGETLYAMLHTDDGNGTFEPANDSAITITAGSPPSDTVVVKAFTVSK